MPSPAPPTRHFGRLNLFLADRARALQPCGGRASIGLALLLLAPLLCGSLLAQEPRGRQPARPGTRPVPDVRAIQQAELAAQRVQLDLREALTLARRVGDADLRERLELLLNRAELEAGQIARGLAGAQRLEPEPVDDKAFQNLMQALKREAFDKDRATFVRTFAAKQRLSSKQAASLLKTFSFDKDRVEAAIIIYPAIVDPENFFEVLALFPFDSDKKKITAALQLDPR